MEDHLVDSVIKNRRKMELSEFVKIVWKNKEHIVVEWRNGPI